MKLGYIDYLNCYPFYHHMFEKEPVPGIDIVPALPGELNRLMAQGGLDMSPISAGAYPEMQGRVLVLPDFCLSSIGYVRSVVLQSKVPIEYLGDARVGLTSASKTSVILLKVLLEKYYGIKPVYRPSAPRPDFTDLDAALVIGNDAMLDAGEPIQYIYDLGDLWLRKTGHPVVFAVFALQKDVMTRYGDKVRKIIRSYNLSLSYLRDYEEEVVSRAGQKYPEIRIDIAQYYRLLKFQFTGPLKDALLFYYREAAELGLLEPVKEIGFVEM